ncbi:MAG: type 1 glutamine amidotransferase domain-containing protein [Actinomycetota bacterium]|nr:type 1 glutamine amidotransferase domain-containing protein [Actinomycetota bacterium]
MSRVLFVLTSHGVLGKDGSPTGFHLGEAALPWRILTMDGHEVDFASPLGGRPPMIAANLAERDHALFLTDSVVAGKLERSLAPDQVDAGRYSAVYFVGGHGAMWDFRRNRYLKAVTRSIYEAGGVVAAICHGQAALVDVTLSDGTYLVAGKHLTAFSHESEQARGLADVVPFALQGALEGRGAHYSCAPDRVAYVKVTDRLVTGQNPASAGELGDRMAMLLAA